jgi:acyl carrier protein
MTADVERALVDLVAQTFAIPRAEVDLDRPIEDAPDSLAMSILVVGIENHFDIAFADRDIGRIRVFRDLVEMIEGKLGRGGR